MVPDIAEFPWNQLPEEIGSYFNDIGKGICPECKDAMSLEEVPPCIYASPCGHRLYQGTLSPEQEED